MTNSRRIHGPASRAVGDEQGTHGWYRRAKETKRGEKGGRESEHLVVSPKRGNRPSWTPWREGDAASSVRRPGTHRGHRTSPASQWKGGGATRGSVRRRDEPDALIGPVRKCGARNSSRHTSSTQLPS